MKAVMDLATENDEQIVVHNLPYVIAIGSCELVLKLQKWNQSVVSVAPTVFECGFKADQWDNIAGLIEPFTFGERGYQWLAGSPDEPSLLLSHSGQW
jgi:hypothetical protein